MSGNKVVDPKKAARTEKSSKLLDLVINAMIALFERRPCDQCGFTTVSASDINNTLKFLKDNGFSVDKEEAEDFLERIKRERLEREAAVKVG